MSGVVIGAQAYAHTLLSAPVRLVPGPRRRRRIECPSKKESAHLRNTRRAVLALSAPAALAIAACGASGSPGGETKSATPKEMTYVKTVTSEVFDNGWRKAFAAASAATNVKATL